MLMCFFQFEFPEPHW